MVGILVLAGICSSYNMFLELSYMDKNKVFGKEIFMRNIFITAEKPEDWKRSLADPEDQWKSGYSAKALAYSWQKANGFPDSIKEVFLNSKPEIFKDLRVIAAMPEYKVNLPGGNQPSQNDIFIIARNKNKIFSITVEGKVSEDFGPKILDWKKDIKSENSGKPKRLEFIKNKLELNNKTNIDNIRYQLMHRTVSAIIQAEELNCSSAMMLVHSFSQNDEHIEDYLTFIELFNLKGKINNISGPVDVNDINLYFSWIRGNEKYLRC